MPLSDELPAEAQDAFENLLEEPEQSGLLRMSKLVGHIFRVPVAYLALLGADLKVVTRVGSGSEHWKYLRTYPVDLAFAKPFLWPNPSGAPPAEFISGDLRFVAGAPLRSIDGVDLGMLVIADVRERLDFSPADYENLVELAGMLAGKMELRMMASQARESELAAIEAENRFRNIADSAPVMIIHSGTDGATSFVNRTWLDFTGRTLEEELSEGPGGSFHPDYRDSALRQYWDAFRERRPITQEFPMRRHDGVYRWMRTHGAPRFRGDGAYAGYVGCFVDVTDQRSAVLALRKQTLIMAALGDAAGAFFLILDPDGRIEQMSPMCQRASGRDPAAMCGRFLWKVCDAAMPAGAAIRDAVRRAVSTRGKVQTTTSCPLPGGKGPAELHWTFTPVVSEQNEVLGVVAATFGLCAGPGCACGGTGFSL